MPPSRSLLTARHALTGGYGVFLQAPQRMWDLYNSSEIAVPTHKTIPTGAPLIAWSNQLEVALENGTSFHYGPHNAVPDWVIQDQRHAYYACVSYVDEHVGAILQALDESGTADNTAVIFHACANQPASIPNLLHCSCLFVYSSETGRCGSRLFT